MDSGRCPHNTKTYMLRAFGDSKLPLDVSNRLNGVCISICCFHRLQLLFEYDTQFVVFFPLKSAICTK